MSQKCITGIFFIVSLCISSVAMGQGAGEVLRYSLQYPSYDPVSMVMPGVAHPTGFGAYQENPAVMALFNESFFSAGLSDRYVSEEGTYLGNTSNFDVNALGISNAGFVYKVPTTRGSLVIGGGYSQTTGYNRAISGFGLNNQTTITDFYAGLPITDPLNEAAFNAFAIDDVFNSEGDRIGSLSILRFLPQGESFRGINQTFEMTEQGVLGEYSAFLATELFRNFVVGASIGALTGSYNYERNFLESDNRGVYDGAFIDTDNDGQGDTDIDRILNESTIEANFTGFSARVGFVYQITPNFNSGVSYQFKNTLYVEEEYSTIITTTLDNEVVFSGDNAGLFNYKIVRPARLNIGLAATNLSGFSFTASAERVAYTEGAIEFEEIELTETENAINNRISVNLQNVFNLRFGLEYSINDRVTPRVGYSFYPSPTENINADRQFYSAGFSSTISENTVLNIGVQYATWQDQNRLYTTDIGTAEVVEEQVSRWNIMGGLKFYF